MRSIAGGGVKKGELTTIVLLIPDQFYCPFIVYCIQFNNLRGSGMSGVVTRLDYSNIIFLNRF